MSVGQIDDFLIQDDVLFNRLNILDVIIQVYSVQSWRDALMVSERGLEYSKRTLGDECFFTCLLTYRLAQAFNGLGEFQKILDLLHGMVDVSTRVAGPIDLLTLDILSDRHSRTGG